jgi:16S rRNA (cytosine1402-N4)-methyltransferase
MKQQPHISVLYQECLEALHPHTGGTYIDGTVGAGGHTLGILQQSAPDGRVIAFDRDPVALSLARERVGAFAGRVTWLKASFADMGQLVTSQVDGVLLDLGVSSMQFDTPERGFSFRYDAPLDMRFSPDQALTAADIINSYPETELADILWRYGEMHDSRRVARFIVDNRPITTTTELASLIAAHTRGRQRRIHPATQPFQALRIAVNDELGALDRGLNAAIDLLKPGGRLAVISFHSLEDRFVKNLFRDLSRDCICPPEQLLCNCNHNATLRLVSRKAIKASEDEIGLNPRSRSARLRVAERL